MELDFEKMGGLVPAIIQDAETGKVLMLAYMNTIAWEKTLETGKAWFYSRSRDKQWMKGEESGNVQIVKEVFVDCDDDTVLLKVEQVGKAACHKGYTSCFFRKVNGDVEVIEEKFFDPDFGSEASAALFENIDEVTAISIQNDIEYMIKMHEPRVELLDVQSLPNYDNNQFDVVIVYKIRGSSNPPQELEFVLLPSR